QTAGALCGFAIGLWSVSCQSIVVRGFLAQKNAVMPSVVACCSILLNIVIAFLLMGPAVRVPTDGFGLAIANLQEFSHIAALGHIGLALAGSLASMVSLVALTALLPRVNIELDIHSLRVGFAKTLVASAVMGAGLMALQSALSTSRIAIVLLSVPLGVALFAGTASLLRLREVRTLYEFAVDSMRGGK
ncbi:MAG: hypothetical protein KDD66_10365, partial [Bdellovibrionales bacterium]|nr:hypothetical protein [Bdellovibrionales bacterium]